MILKEGTWQNGGKLDFGSPHMKNVFGVEVESNLSTQVHKKMLWLKKTYGPVIGYKSMGAQPFTKLHLLHYYITIVGTICFFFLFIF